MRLLLADDHDLVRDALKLLVERSEDGAEVLTAASLYEALDVAEREPRLDVALLDLRMPGMEGGDGLARLKALRPDLPMVVMSGTANQHDIDRVLEKGAFCFFPKTLSGRALVSALKLVLDGERFVPVSAMQRAVADGAPGGAAISFTRRERQVLDRLLRGQSNKEIARELSLSEVTVKLHLRGVFRKLGARNRTQAATMALERGLDRG